MGPTGASSNDVETIMIGESVEMDVDDRQPVVDAKHAILIEIALRDGAVLDGQLFVECHVHAEYRAAFDLCAHGTTVRDAAALEGDIDLADAELSLRTHLHPSRRAHDRAGIVHRRLRPARDGDTSPFTLGQWPPPTRLFGGDAQAIGPGLVPAGYQL